MQGSPPSGNLGVAGPIISWYDYAFRRCIMNDRAHRRRAVSTVLDGTFSTTCVTEASGMCIVMAPNEADVTVTQDAPPPGMAPRENPISTTVVTEFAGVLFINLPTGTDPAPEPAPSLPDTGTGPGAESGSTLAVTLAATSALLATGALITRKRPA